MKTIRKLQAALALLSTLNPQLATTFAQGTAFTYQGRLDIGGAPPNGAFDLRFSIFDAASGGSEVTGPLTNAATAVSNGLFTVTLDFGAGVFTGPPRWLEISVRTNSSEDFTALSPRQPILPAPYAVFAAAADSLDGQDAASFAASSHAHDTADIASGTLGPDRGGTGLDTSATAAGSLLRTTGAGAWGILPPGSNGQVLKISAGTPVWGTDNNSGGTVTSVATGSGLTGGPITTSGTISITPGGVTNSHLAINAVSSANVLDGTIVNADIAATAAIADSKLATISTAGKVANSATTATSANTANAIVARDASGNFTAGTISAATDLLAGRLNVGAGHTLSGARASITAGSGNTNTANDAVVAGGILNSIAGASGNAVIGGGAGNQVRANNANCFIGAGNGNLIETNALNSVIGGGIGNAIARFCEWSVIGGGQSNTIGFVGLAACIPGGRFNSATGDTSFAAGRRAKANHGGAFVWGDATDADIASTNANSMTFRAAGGVRFFSNSGATAGVFLAPGGTSWAAISDRNAKKNFASVDAVEVLEKLAALPVQRWNYQWETDDAVPHLGPTAQDFKAAFYPGRDDKTITTQEADGVALAAIQGLNQKLEAELAAQTAELKSRDVRIAELEQRLTALEKRLSTLAWKGD